MVERMTLNHVVAGSIPAVGDKRKIDIFDLILGVVLWYQQYSIYVLPQVDTPIYIYQVSSG